MSVTYYKRGEPLKCPHCGKTEGDPVEDYVIPSRPHHPVQEMCGWCDEVFSIALDPTKDEYAVRD